MTSVLGVSMRRTVRTTIVVSHLDCQDVAVRGSSGIRDSGLGIRDSGFDSGFGIRRVRVQSGRRPTSNVQRGSWKLGIGLRLSLRPPPSCVEGGNWELIRPSLFRGWLREIRLRRGLVLDRRDLVRVDPHHQVVDVIVDLREPVARARRDHDDVAWFEVQGHAVANF